MLVIARAESGDQPAARALFAEVRPALAAHGEQEILQRIQAALGSATA